MSTGDPDPLVGTTLGSFKITKVIGRGGMGTVYLGEHSVIGSRVAIKVLMERLASDESLVSRFYAEARAVNLIGHENIVNIFDMNVVPPSRYYLVMEYLEGKPLNYLLTDAVPAAIAVPILVQVCDALQAAHDAGIVHRDLKPENIFLIKRKNAENFVKVLDFGLAKLLDTERSTQNTAAGLIVGTPEFMSPEQANSTPVDGRSDVYSLGCIAWLLATGRLPFPQRGLTDLLVAHRSMQPKPPHEANPNVPRALSDAIMHAMAKRPEARFQTAREFGEALEKALRTVTTPKPIAMPQASPPTLARGVPGVVAQAGQPQVRFTTKFQAVITGLDGTSFGTLECQDISKGGMFLSSTGVLPNVFSRVKVTIPSAGNLGVLAEVVRHVPADQARAWNMAPGFGVQFVELTPQLRESLIRLTQGLPVVPKIAQPEVSAAVIDAGLHKWRDRMNGDHYVIIGATPEADLIEVRNKGAEALKELNALKSKAIDPNQRAQVEAALTRVQGALDVLGVPGPRARFDANRGNFRGIARCIMGGLGPLDLERLRQEHLSHHPTSAGAAHVKFLASKGFEANNQVKEAYEACEAALQLDPLNLQLHQRHAGLARRLKDMVKT